MYLCMHPRAVDVQRPIGCLIAAGHFPQKSPIIRGSFAERDLRPKASRAFFATLHPHALRARAVPRRAWHILYLCVCVFSCSAILNVQSARMHT